MTDVPTFRIAQNRDLPALAALRWSLKDEHGETGGADRDAFIAQFVDACADNRPGEFTHWVAETRTSIIAVVSIQRVRKAPKPGAIHGHWGYVTNVYASQEARGEGVAARLLERVKEWAQQESYEFLLLWAADRARNFYMRAGFSAPADVLMLELAPDGQTEKQGR